ncbi:type II secretion system protein [Thermosynechococcaceae cyanobacterium BACA0444]|uniref:Type II secretion system protein n=1 Tax=Pseudocalidococcus azoricus BACA0444 TaxID=2918990 RepID=A0AAE4FQI1_9CYAN|nr:type II secretion system protein [Pseudocalidococcus azoricus]MDS3860419.1 type II secretion system protein [Pseudocalidococcus azoricus BACA0444]
MRRLNVPNSKGFTLPEMLVVVVIIGILAAVFVPSFLRWLNNQRIKDALVKVEGTFKEAQREAIRNGKNCSFTVSTSGGVTTLTDTDPSNKCLVTGARVIKNDLGSFLSPNIEVQFTGGPDFAFKNDGQTDFGNSTTFILSIPNSGAQQRCLVVSSGIGIMRNGTYSGSTCTSTQIQ